MAVKITTYKWFYNPKSGLGEYTVSWKDPYGTVVCSMDVKVVGEHSEVMKSLSLAADSLRKMYPTKFVSLDDPEVITVIDTPSPQSMENEDEPMMDTDEEVIDFVKGGADDN